MLATIHLSACYVVPKASRAEMSAIAVRRGSFMGVHGIFVSSEVPGSKSLGAATSSQHCGAGTGREQVTVQLVSYGEPDLSSLCANDDLARTLHEVRNEIRQYTGFDPRVRQFVIRLVPEGTAYRGVRWSIGRNNLTFDFAARVDAVDLNTGSEKENIEALQRSRLTRRIAHELFHIAVGLSGQRFPQTFSARFANELAAHLIEPCIELSVLGWTRGGSDEGRVEAGGYVGADDQPPEGAVPQTAWVASIMAGIRASKLLADISGEKRVSRDSPQAEQMLEMCRTHVQSYLSAGDPERVGE